MNELPPRGGAHNMSFRMVQQSSSARENKLEYQFFTNAFFMQEISIVCDEPERLRLIRRPM
jgi:hypothetical protein